ncbi:MAG: LuxR C-terminal-related transcriptional regulator, partial [Streptosporangiaceae bacterium]
PLPGARAEGYLAPARRLGDAGVSQLWANGCAMTSETAVALALGSPMNRQADRFGSGAGADPELTVVRSYRVSATPPSSLTSREEQVAALVASGLSNKAIAVELSISPTTAARHVANILAKLGFSSRSQIAAWFAERAGEGGSGGGEGGSGGGEGDGGAEQG